MKILVIGLLGIIPEILFETEQLENIHRLMEYGAYGWLETTAADQQAAWLSLVTGQASSPHSDRNAQPIWEKVQNAGRGYILVGDPQSIGQNSHRGITIGSLAAQPEDKENSESLTLLMAEWADLLAAFSEGEHDDSTYKPGAQLDRIYALSSKQFQVASSLMTSREWGYFQFIDIGLPQIHHWYSQPAGLDRHLQEAHQSYYIHLDQKIGEVLEILSDDTILLLISPVGSISQPGVFTLLSANSPLFGEIKGARLIDITPTLLELGGYEIPASIEGESLVASLAANLANTSHLSEDEEALLRERLSGLGYI